MEKVFNSEDKKDLRRKLRKESTPEEKLLWKYLMGQQQSYKFHRQYGIGRYIVDFYCPSKKLVIELDGSQHYTEEEKEYDEIRDDFIKSIGIKTIRFSNLEIKRDIKVVVERIRSELLKR